LRAALAFQGGKITSAGLGQERAGALQRYFQQIVIARGDRRWQILEGEDEAVLFEIDGEIAADEVVYSAVVLRVGIEF
jgi:hypothetical protein